MTPTATLAAIANEAKQSKGRKAAPFHLHCSVATLLAKTA
jgi:hypothetical protein